MTESSWFEALLYFLAGIAPTLIIFIYQLWQKRSYNNAIKNIIKKNIIQLVKIYDRLYSDVEEFDGNDTSDQNRVDEIVLYFERKYTIIEMIRYNIQNQLAHFSPIISSRKKDAYDESITQILDDLDALVELCHHPKLPNRYQLSVWRDQRDKIQMTTKHTIDTAREKLKIS